MNHTKTKIGSKVSILKSLFIFLLGIIGIGAPLHLFFSGLYSTIIFDIDISFWNVLLSFLFNWLAYIDLLILLSICLWFLNLMVNYIVDPANQILKICLMVVAFILGSILLSKYLNLSLFNYYFMTLSSIISYTVIYKMNRKYKVPND